MLVLLLLAGCAPQRPDPARDPLGADPTDACPTGQVLDGGTCVAEACGVGTWGDVPVDGDTIHVAPGGDGDGTGAHPLGSVQAAVDLASERGGGLVALAAGTYPETVSMGRAHDGVTLAGRCRELVTLDGSGGDEVPALQVLGEAGRRAPEVGVRGLTVTGGRYVGVWAQLATVDVEAADVVANAVIGLLVGEAEVSLDTVRVVDTEPDRRGTYGRGVDVEAGGTLRATGLEVTGNADSGVFVASGGSSVELVDCVVSDTAPAGDGTGGVGFRVQDGAHLDATGCTLARNGQVGVLALDEGTRVTLVDTVVEDNVPVDDGTGGRGIEVQAGAVLVATGCTVRGNADSGIFAVGDGTTVTLEDTVVADTVPTPDGVFGRGIEAQAGAAVTATGCVVSDNTRTGVYAEGEGTSVQLVDTTVHGTVPQPDGVEGRGLDVEEGAVLAATRCTVEGNADAGVIAVGAGARAELVDTVVRDTEPSAGGINGWGLAAVDGGEVVTTGCTVAGSHGVGVIIGGAGASASLVDTVVEDTVPLPDGGGGRGIEVQDGATLTATGGRVSGNQAFGVYAGSGAVAALESLVVEGTLRGPLGASARGIGVEQGAALTATGCTVSGNADNGVVGSSASSVDLVDTVVEDTRIGPDGSGGRGVTVQTGAALTLTGGTIRGNTELGVYASGSGTVAEVVDTDILDTRRGTETAFGLGAGAQYEASLTLEGSTVSGTEGPGLYAVYDARVTARSTVVEANSFAGVVALSAVVELDGVTVVDNGPDAQWGGGFGVYATDQFGWPTLTLSASTVGSHPYAAVWLDGDGAYLIDGNDLSGAAPLDLRGWPVHGNAVFAERGVTAGTGGAGLSLVGNTLHDASEVAVLLDGSSATLDGNTFDANGTDVWQQRCEGVPTLASPEPGWVACDAGILLTDFSTRLTTIYLAEPEAEGG